MLRNNLKHDVNSDLEINLCLSIIYTWDINFQLSDNQM